jgi:hypothetical protein
MKLSSIQFPWETTERGQGFFIPCLDPDSVRELGLRKAVFCRVLDARAKTGIYEGFTGVFFFRLPDRKLRPLDSVSP